MAKQNILTRSKRAKADEAFRENRLLDARKLYVAVCDHDRLDAEAWLRLSIINRRLGDFCEAETCARQAFRLEPKSPDSLLALGNALQCQGRIQESISIYRDALQLDPKKAEAHYFIANALKDSGGLTEAITHYESAIELNPNFVEALSNLGAALTLSCRLKEATEYLNRANEIQPNLPQVLCNMGSILMMDSRFVEARSKFEKALTYAPESIDAISKLAELFERTSRLNDAKPLVDRGLSLAPAHAVLNLIAAKIARSENRFLDAISILEKIPPDNISDEIKADIYLSLGKLYDRVHDSERAFHYITVGNQLVEKSLLREGQRSGNYWEKINRLESLFTSSSLSSLKAIQFPDANLNPTPVFLMGFARSGTTLLDQILDSHPKLQSVEEKPGVEVMVEAFLEISKEKANAFTELNMEEVEHLRRIYFSAMAPHVTLKPGNILVDKMPLNTTSAHLIWRIFPKAKFIFAVRHPCDVCLSCFMQNFALNEAMSNFLTLEGTARLYVKVMSLWREYVSVLPINAHYVKYENLVDDFDGETKRLFDFLDVGWDEAVRLHTEHARHRSITTPSYHQVTQPIYKHASYRWQRYSGQLEPITKMLEPFVKYFGY